MFDEYMGMPEKPWLPASSFQTPATPPAAGPLAGTLVQLPCINADWLPLVLGALDQLRNPTAWPDTLTDSSLNDVLNQVDELRDAFNVISVPCCNVAMRLTAGCGLQFSVDGGTTWIDVTDWNTNFAPCVQTNAPVTSPPPNPGGKTPDQLSCAIATYLAVQVVQASMQKAVDDILASRSLLQYGLDIILLLPGFYWSALFVEAIGLIYGEISAGTLSDYESALTDSTLWSDVKCAIYDGIVLQGKITPSNFTSIVTNLGAIPYAHSDVITTIHDYVQKLGFVGLAELAQPAGLEVGEDCSTCAASWCYRWDFRAGMGIWDIANTNATYSAGTGFIPVVDTFHGYTACQIHIPGGFTATPILSVELILSAPCVATSSDRRQIESEAGTNFAFYSLASGFNDQVCPHPGGTQTMSDMVIRMDCNANVGAGGGYIQQVIIRGTGTNPFGTSNC